MSDHRLAALAPARQVPIGPEAGLSVAQRLDRLPVTALHVAIVALSTLGLFADIAEVALSNALAAVFLAPPYSMPRGDLALLLASVFAGGAIGAPVFGAIGDRFGRKRALQGSLVLMALASLAAAASPDLTSLTIARCISGFAIGGYPPLVTTYLADLLPPRRRGLLMLVCTGLGFLGAPAIILLIRWFTPMPPLGIDAWRWALGLGGIAAGITAILFAWMPESPRWLAAIGRGREADLACRRLEASAGIAAPEVMQAEPAGDGGSRAGFRALLADPLQIRRTVRFLGLYALAPLGDDRVSPAQRRRPDPEGLQGRPVAGLRGADHARSDAREPRHGRDHRPARTSPLSKRLRRRRWRRWASSSPEART